MLSIFAKKLDCAQPLRETAAAPQVRPARPTDVPCIVQLQMISLPHFPLPEPSRAFLQTFYGFVVRQRQGRLLVSEHNRSLAGFVLGASDPTSLCQQVASDRSHLLTAASVCLVRRPVQLPRLLRELRGLRRLPDNRTVSVAAGYELVTIAVQPRLRRQGHGKALIQALAAAARHEQMTRLCIHLAANDKTMASFYEHLGFTAFRSFKAVDGRWMDEYVMALPGSLEPAVSNRRAMPFAA